MSLAGLPDVGNIIGGRYRIDHVLGRGGMGIVYAATDTELQLNMPVAVKWMLPESVSDPTAVERFLQEARCAAAIRHPNVVTIFGIGSAGAPYIVMELLQGRTLAQLLTEHWTAHGRPLTPSEAAPYFLPVLRGVQAAHETTLSSPGTSSGKVTVPSVRGIVHRDLKPDNIFLTQHGDEMVPKVLDFGIAKPADKIGTSSTLTGDGSFPGTPGYMAPEQLFDPSRIGPWTDVYALGVILYEMLAGQPPFQGTTPLDIAMKVGQGTFLALTDRIEGFPQALDQVVQRAMARDVEQRFPDVRSLEKALRPLLTATAHQVAPDGPGATRSGTTGGTYATDGSLARTPQPMEVRAPVAPTAPGRAPVWVVMAGLAAAGLGTWLWTDTGASDAETPDGDARSSFTSSGFPPEPAPTEPTEPDPVAAESPIATDGWEVVATDPPDAGTERADVLPSRPEPGPITRQPTPVRPPPSRHQTRGRPRHAPTIPRPATPAGGTASETPAPGSQAAKDAAYRAGKLRSDEF